jgi:hypothetical protein
MLEPISITIGLQFLCNHAAAKALEILVMDVEHAHFVLNPFRVWYKAPTSMQRIQVWTKSGHVPQGCKGEFHPVDGIKDDAAGSPQGIVNTNLHLSSHSSYKSVPVVCILIPICTDDRRNDDVMKAKIIISITSVENHLNGNVEGKVGSHQLLEVGPSSFEERQTSKARNIKVAKIVAEHPDDL